MRKSCFVARVYVRYVVAATMGPSCTLSTIKNLSAQHSWPQVKMSRNAWSNRDIARADLNDAIIFP